MEGGSAHSFGSSEWNAFGRRLVDALKRHLEATDLNGEVRDLQAAVDWSMSKDATTFFDKYIPREGRGRKLLFYGETRRA
jgi:hypothetical protein